MNWSGEWGTDDSESVASRGRSIIRPVDFDCHVQKHRSVQHVLYEFQDEKIYEVIGVVHLKLVFLFFGLLERGCYRKKNYGSLLWNRKKIILFFCKRIFSQLHFYFFKIWQRPLNIVLMYWYFWKILFWVFVTFIVDGRQVRKSNSYIKIFKKINKEITIYCF